MSEHITHIAVYEDSIIILKHSPEFPSIFKQSVERFPDCGLMSSATRGNHLHALPLLDKARKKSSHSDDDLKQVAAALGWLTHRAADLTVKPLFRVTDKESATTGIPEDVHEIYHDAFTFKWVYDSGKRKSVSPMVELSRATLETEMKSHPAADVSDTSLAEFVFTGLVHSEVMGLHQFANETGQDVEAWLEKFLSRRQRLYEDLRIYIGAFQNPDPKLVEKFITGPNFYNEKDELIHFVRTAGSTAAGQSFDLNAAIEKSAKQSIYAQALALSCKFLNAASDFYSGRISASETYDILDIMPKAHRLVN